MFSNIILRKKKSVLFNVNNKTTLNHSQLLCKPVFFLCWGVPWHQDRFPITNTQKESRRAGQWVEGIRLSTYDNFTRCERHQYPRFTDEKTESQSQVSNLPEITKLKDVETMTQVGSDSNTSTGQPTGLFIPTPVCHICSAVPPLLLRLREQSSEIMREGLHPLQPPPPTVCLAETCLSRTPLEFGLVSKARRLHSNVTFWNPHSMFGSLCHSKSCPIIFWY